MRQSDIIDKLAKRHPNMSTDQIKLILTSFHDGFRYYLSRPEECKGGILINGLLSATVPIKRVEKFIHDIKIKNLAIRHDINSKRHKRTKEEVIEYYENLLTILKKHERQKRTKSDNDGFTRRISVEISEAETDSTESRND